MANTINDLYLKYVKNVGKLENDRYFQYLYQIIEASNNTFKQQHQIMHKVVDEKWLSTIEESLDAINRIIEKPRRFVARKEEVVPVELAKKITADSVRHLSMHTQYIASAKGDSEIQPTHILNVSNEESFDLYENRFIYHLILRLVTFIDKRTDIIFWSTGDETRNTFEMESKIDDAYEQIEYKVQMTVKNRQNFMEADADNLNVFMRIDRVRRLVLALRASSFCDLMAGCQKVRSPIQRTNLLMKDPDYRTCYKLWQFLESYEDVGYSIDVQKRTLEFDEEYMIQMYINLITNYTVFKTITEEDERRLDKIPPKRRRVLKPKFIRTIEEELVDDYDLPDVEVRQVLVEEVTQAQLDAEAKLAEEIKAREHAEQALEEAEDTIRDYAIKTESALDAMAQAKEKEFAAVKSQKKTETQLAETEAQLAALQTESKAQLEALQNESDEKIANLQSEAASKLEAFKLASEEQIAELKQEAAQKLAQQKAESDNAYEEQKKYYTDFIASQKNEMEQQLSEMVKSHVDELESQKAASDTVLAAQKAASDAALEAQKRSAEAELKEYIAAAEDKIAESKKASDIAMAELKDQTATAYAKLQADTREQLKVQQRNSENAYNFLKNESDEKLASQKAEAEAALEKHVMEAQQALEAVKAEAIAKEIELSELIAQLTKEKEILIKTKQELEYENAQLSVQLSRETEAREQATQRAEHESKLRELVEERAGSETIGDFITRSRAERRERRKQEK